MRKLTPSVAWGLIVAVALVSMSAPAEAMPQFSRKYNIPCSGCHDALAVPRLNDVGFKFRRAGFRMPEQIGKDELSDFTLGDYFAGRIQVRYTVSHVEDGSVNPSTSATTNAFLMQEITIYPITGSFQKNWASETEISMAPDEIPELENAWIRGVWGNEDMWFEARAGLYHPFEGYGASDRPLSVSRPLFETSGANQNQDTLFRIWGRPGSSMDHVGVEVGLQWRDTSLSAAVYNQLNTEVENGAVIGVGITPTTQNGKDFLVFANQIIDSHSGVSAYWAHGVVKLPTNVADFVNGASEETWDNTYDRLALFASWGTGPFEALAGGEMGFDHARDATTGNLTSFRSQGAFVEGNYAFGEGKVAFARLDYFDPSTDKDNNTMLGVTAGVTLQADWIYVIPEFQYRSTATATGDRTTENFLIHGIVIY